MLVITQILLDTSRRVTALNELGPCDFISMVNEKVVKSENISSSIFFKLLRYLVNISYLTNEDYDSFTGKFKFLKFVFLRKLISNSLE